MKTTHLVFLLSFVAAAGSAAGQQVVHGTVTERGSGQSIEGAMVVLLRGDGLVARVLSAADGSFTMTVRQPGRYELRIDRIGYSSTLSEAFDLPPGARVVRNLLTEVRPVDGPGRCQLRPERGLATATVWEEVRKALAAATWTTERELYRFAWFRYVRELDAQGATSPG